MFKFINFSIKFFIVFLIVIIFFMLSTLWYFSIGLPDYKKLSNYQPPISSRVYSQDGKLIAEYALQKRLFVPYESIPDVVINSFLSAEDKNFFKHPGVDAKGIIRAVVNNLKNITQNNFVKKYLSILDLNKSTALLPIFNLKKTKKTFGKNTKDALNTGFLWGYEGLINNIIDKIIQRRKDQYKIILTGGYASLFKKMIKMKSIIDQNITIKGITKVYKELL